MDVTILDTPADVGRAAAHRVADMLLHDPALVLGLPAGRTPVAAYTELGRLHALGRADFSQATAFLLDEFVGLDDRHPGSFRRFLAEHLLSGINLPPGRTHGLNGLASDMKEECDRYEAAIARSAGLGLLLLGIGRNGHVGFNEPGEALEARTHCVRLLESTRRDNARLFGGDVARVPTHALSMGMGTMLGAATVLVIATGEQKADVVARMVRGPLTTRLPASFLQLHRDVDVYLDQAAASGL